jgi:hypothetical protein
MNGDGRKDFVTARSNAKAVPGKSDGGVYIVTMDASDITLTTGTF